MIIAIAGTANGGYAMTAVSAVFGRRSFQYHFKIRSKVLRGVAVLDAIVVDNVTRITVVTALSVISKMQCARFL